MSEEPERRSRIWAFLNSAFFLWFLSSVVLSGVTFFYTQRQTQLQEARAKQEKKDAEDLARKQKKDADDLARVTTQKRLDAEIESRLCYAHNLTKTRIVSSEALTTALVSLERPLDGRYPVNVFPEYSSQSLRWLLWELLETLPAQTQSEKDEKQRVLVAYDRAKRLQMLYIHQAFVAGPRDVSRDVDNLKKLTFLYMDLDRWGRPFSWEKHGPWPQLPKGDRLRAINTSDDEDD